jgi:hypothetical protein
VRHLIAGILLVVMIVVGYVAISGVLDSRARFTDRLPGGQSHSSIGVELRDATGLVIAIEAGEVTDFDDVRPGGTVENPPGQMNVLVVRWLGGACDDRAELALAPAADGYALSLETVRKLGLGCTGAGVPRAVNVILSRGVDASTVSVNRP